MALLARMSLFAYDCDYAYAGMNFRIWVICNFNLFHDNSFLMLKKKVLFLCFEYSRVNYITL